MSLHLGQRGGEGSLIPMLQWDGGWQEVINFNGQMNSSVCPLVARPTALERMDPSVYLLVRIDPSQCAYTQVHDTRYWLDR